MESSTTGPHPGPVIPNLGTPHHPCSAAHCPPEAPLDPSSSLLSPQSAQARTDTPPSALTEEFLEAGPNLGSSDQQLSEHSFPLDRVKAVIDASVMKSVSLLTDALDKLENRLLHKLNDEDGIRSNPSFDTLKPRKLLDVDTEEAHRFHIAPALLKVDRHSQLSNNRTSGATLASVPLDQFALEHAVDNMCLSQSWTKKLSATSPGQKIASRNSSKNSAVHKYSQAQSAAPEEEHDSETQDCCDEDHVATQLAARRCSQTSSVSQLRPVPSTSSWSFFKLPSIADIRTTLGSPVKSASASTLRSGPSFKKSRSSTSSSSWESVTSMSGLSQGRSDQLVQEAMRGSVAKMASAILMGECEDPGEIVDTNIVLGIFPAAWLWMSGIVSWSDRDWRSPLISAWCTTLNRSFVLIVLIAIMVFCTHELTTMRKGVSREMCDLVLCRDHLLTAAVSLGMGCFLRLLSAFYYNDQVVGHSGAVLTAHLASVGVSSSWVSSSRHDMLKVFVLWLCWMGVCVYTSFGWHLNGMRISFHLGAIAISTNVFCAFAFHMVQVCRGLYLSLDNFCLTLVAEGSCDGAAKNWNILMAIQKRVCATVARTYILLLTSAIAAVLFPISFGRNLFGILPGACALLLMLWVSLFICDVTSRCDRVPAFINTLDFTGDNFDYKRQYVVDYVTHSRAGFYMFDVRVTAETVVKTAYICSVIGLAVASNRVNF